MSKRIFEIDIQKTDINFALWADKNHHSYILTTNDGKKILVTHGDKFKKDFSGFSRSQLADLKVNYVVCCSPKVIMESFVDENLSWEDMLEDENGHSAIDEKLPEFIFGSFHKEIVWTTFQLWTNQEFDLYGFKGNQYLKAKFVVATTKKECNFE